MSDSDKKQGFTTTDRRSVSEEGDARPTPAASAAEGPAAGKSQPASGPASGPARIRDLPPADFSTFVLSLGSSALIHLGQVEAPGEGGRQLDLPMAKHTIDLLDLLREKTKNNLSKEEDELLESLLYDLRLRYVEAVKAGS
jgi:hypothetical protein